MTTALIPYAQQLFGSSKVNTVNARDLHKFLGVKTQYNKWIARRLKQYRFFEDLDYCRAKSGEDQTDPIEYHLSFDTAKKLAMVERTERGDEARRYFLACEKALTEVRQRVLISRPNVVGLLPKERAIVQEKAVKREFARNAILMAMPIEEAQAECRRVGFTEDELSATDWGDEDSRCETFTDLRLHYNDTVGVLAVRAPKQLAAAVA